MNWREVRLRRVLMSTGGSWGTEPEEGEVVARCVRGTDFDYDVLRVNRQRAPLRGFGLSEFKKRSTRRGDLIVEKSGGGEQQPVGRVVLHDADEPVVPTNFAGRLRPVCGVDSRFLCYVMASLYTDGRTMAAIKQATGIQNLDLEALLENQIAIPSETAQRTIADYLDAETGRTNALIAKKRGLADLLHERSEQRQIEVACGRSLGVPTKDSGHGWLGQIPRHWPVERLKYTARIESGHTPSRSRRELWENCTIPWITLNDVAYLESNEFIEDTVNSISEDGLAASSARVLPPGTVVLSRDATVGRCGILVRPMATSQHFVNWLCSGRLRPRFLWLLFRTSMQTHFSSLTAGATLMTIGMPEVKRLVIPVPPLSEQDELVAQAERLRSEADRARRLLGHQLALLHERREALITAAVTGQLDIPGAA